MKKRGKLSSKKYKFQGGTQQVYMDTPDYSKAYEIEAEANAKNKTIGNVAQQFSGAYAPIGQVGGMAGDLVRNRVKDKKAGATIGGALEMGATGAALGAKIGGPWGAAIGGVGGAIYGGIMGNKEYEKKKKAAQEEEKRVQRENLVNNYYAGYKGTASTDAQAALAKYGKYKVKSKQPRMIETEGREPIFSPKKADGSRDLLYYNPNDPTHAEGGVKAMVMPKNRYNNGTSNLMPKRSKVSLLGSGNMAVGAKQLKVNTLNDAAFSENLTGIPAVNAANKFVQPLAGIQQVARNIPEDRRKEKIRTPRSHKKVNPDTNRIIDPPMLYEMKPPPPRSTFNTKNDFNKGSKKVKVYR
jgi:hypothetical protein